MTKAKRGLDRSAPSTAACCFGGVTRDSVRDWKRWNERYRVKPIDETPGALRVALVKNKARHKWQVQVILGARRHTFIAYDDQLRAQEGYSPDGRSVSTRRGPSCGR